MTIGLAVQKAIRARLVATEGVTALVPAEAILDRNSRPAPDPSIIIGEDQIVDEGRIARDVWRVYATVHVWKKEAGLTGAKAIVGAIHSALRTPRLAIEAPYRAGDCLVASARFLRDPDGETAHGVVSVELLVGEVT